MEVQALSEQDRAVLLAILRRFRVLKTEHPNEDGSGYKNRDELEVKLETGVGNLDQVDEHVLHISVYYVSHHLMDVLPQDPLVPGL